MSPRRRKYVERGHVTGVHDAFGGSELLVAASAGATQIQVRDAGDFDELGGQLKIRDGDLSEQISYQTYDPETNILPLYASLVNAYTAESRVRVFPATRVRYAHVALDDDDGDAIIAVVPMNLRVELPPGTRSYGEQETVTVALRGDEWYVTDVHGDESKQEQIAVYSKTQVVTGISDLPFFAPWDCEIVEARAGLTTPGSSGTTIIDIHRGTPPSSIWKTFTTRRPQITAGAGPKIDDAGEVERDTFSKGKHVLRIEVVQVATGAKGLSVYVHLRRL